MLSTSHNPVGLVWVNHIEGSVYDDDQPGRSAAVYRTQVSLQPLHRTAKHFSRSDFLRQNLTLASDVLPGCCAKEDVRPGVEGGQALCHWHTSSPLGKIL